MLIKPTLRFVGPHGLPSGPLGQASAVMGILDHK